MFVKSCWAPPRFVNTFKILVTLQMTLIMSSKKRLNLKIKIVVQNIYAENIFLKDLSTTFKYRVVIKVTEISECW